MYLDTAVYKLLNKKKKKKNHNTWKPKSNLINSSKVINDFHKSNPSTPHKLCTNIFEGLVFKSFENLCDPVNILSRLEVEN